MCKYNPKFVNHICTKDLVYHHCRRRDNNGDTALIQLFCSSHAWEVKFSSPMFVYLYKNEKDIINKNGYNAMTFLQKYNPLLEKIVITAISKANKKL